MAKDTLKGCLLVTGGVLGGWFAIRYALPVLLPFLLGGGLALAAEPMVRLMDGRCKRWIASGVGVSAVFLLLTTLLVLLAALLFRQAGRVTAMVPELAEGIRMGMDSLEGWMLTAASEAPKSIRTVLGTAVTDFFSDGSAVVERVASTLPGVLTRVFGHVTSGFLTVATAVLASFMISAKLPAMRQWLGQRIPPGWRSRYVPVLKGLRRTVTGWLMAQLKLTAVIMALLLVCFWLLRLPHAPFWAFAVALVDALPVLGCGVVLVPWSLICLLQGQRLRSIGLLGTYVLTWLVRSVLEPRLLGRELGLDPLMTLLAIYTGYRLLGLPGMLLAPLIAVTLTKLGAELSKKGKHKPNSP